jgi:hypothetical protein
MFEEAHSLHAFIDGCESSADAAINANVRQAAGLQRLHELALLKELQAEPQTLLSAVAHRHRQPKQLEAQRDLQSYQP